MVRLNAGIGHYRSWNLVRIETTVMIHSIRWPIVLSMAKEVAYDPRGHNEE